MVEEGDENIMLCQSDEEIKWMLIGGDQQTSHCWKPILKQISSSGFRPKNAAINSYHATLTMMINRASSFLTENTGIVVMYVLLHDLVRWAKDVTLDHNVGLMKAQREPDLQQLAQEIADADLAWKNFIPSLKVIWTIPLPIDFLNYNSYFVRKNCQDPLSQREIRACQEYTDIFKDNIHQLERIFSVQHPEIEVLKLDDLLTEDAMDVKVKKDGPLVKIDPGQPPFTGPYLPNMYSNLAKNGMLKYLIDRNFLPKPDQDVKLDPLPKAKTLFDNNSETELKGDTDVVLNKGFEDMDVTVSCKTKQSASDHSGNTDMHEQTSRAFDQDSDDLFEGFEEAGGEPNLRKYYESDASKKNAAKTEQYQCTFGGSDSKSASLVNASTSLEDEESSTIVEVCTSLDVKDQELSVAPNLDLSVIEVEETSVASDIDVSVAEAEEASAAPDMDVSVVEVEEASVAPEMDVSVDEAEEASAAPDIDVSVDDAEEASAAPDIDVSVLEAEETLAAPDIDVSVVEAEEASVAPNIDVSVVEAEEALMAPDIDVSVVEAEKNIDAGDHHQSSDDGTEVSASEGKSIVDGLPDSESQADHLVNASGNVDSEGHLRSDDNSLAHDSEDGSMLATDVNKSALESDSSAACDNVANSTSSDAFTVVDTKAQKCMDAIRKSKDDPSKKQHKEMTWNKPQDIAYDCLEINVDDELIYDDALSSSSELEETAKPERPSSMQEAEKIVEDEVHETTMNHELDKSKSVRLIPLQNDLAASLLAKYYEKVPMCQENFMKKEQIFIGLQFIAELRITEANSSSTAPIHVCILCNKQIASKTVLVSHVNSVPHKLKCAKLHLPDVHERFGSIPLPEWTPNTLREFREELQEAASHLLNYRICVINKEEFNEASALITENLDKLQAFPCFSVDTIAQPLIATPEEELNRVIDASSVDDCALAGTVAEQVPQDGAVETGAKGLEKSSVPQQPSPHQAPTDNSARLSKTNSNAVVSSTSPAPEVTQAELQQRLGGAREQLGNKLPLHPDGNTVKQLAFGETELISELTKNWDPANNADTSKEGMRRRLLSCVEQLDKLHSILLDKQDLFTCEASSHPDYYNKWCEFTAKQSAMLMLKGVDDADHECSKDWLIEWHKYTVIILNNKQEKERQQILRFYGFHNVKAFEQICKEHNIKFMIKKIEASPTPIEKISKQTKLDYKKRLITPTSPNPELNGLGGQPSHFTQHGVPANATPQPLMDNMFQPDSVSKRSWKLAVLEGSNQKHQDRPEPEDVSQPASELKRLSGRPSSFPPINRSTGDKQESSTGFDVIETLTELDTLKDIVPTSKFCIVDLLLDAKGCVRLKQNPLAIFHLNRKNIYSLHQIYTDLCESIDSSRATPEVYKGLEGVRWLIEEVRKREFCGISLFEMAKNTEDLPKTEILEIVNNALIEAKLSTNKHISLKKELMEIIERLHIKAIKDKVNKVVEKLKVSIAAAKHCAPVKVTNEMQNNLSKDVDNIFPIRQDSALEGPRDRAPPKAGMHDGDKRKCKRKTAEEEHSTVSIIEPPACSRWVAPGLADAAAGCGREASSLGTGSAMVSDSHDTGMTWKRGAGGNDGQDFSSNHEENLSYPSRPDRKRGRDQSLLHLYQPIDGDENERHKKPRTTLDSHGGPGKSRGGPGNSRGGPGNSRRGPGNSLGEQGNNRGGQRNSFGGQGNSCGGQRNGRGGQRNSRGGQRNSRGGQGNSLGGPGYSRGGPGNSRGGPGNSRGGPGNSRGGPGNSRGGLGNSRGGPGNSRGGPGNSRGGPGNSRGGPGNSRGGPGNSRGGPGNSRGGPGYSRGGPGYSRGGPGYSRGGPGNSRGGPENSRGGPENSRGRPGNYRRGPSNDCGRVKFPTERNWDRAAESCVSGPDWEAPEQTQHEKSGWDPLGSTVYTSELDRKSSSGLSYAQADTGGPAVGGPSFGRAGAWGSEAGSPSHGQTGSWCPEAGGPSHGQTGTWGPEAGGPSHGQTGTWGPEAGGPSHGQTGTWGPEAGGPSHGQTGTWGPEAGGPSYSQAGALGPAAGGPSYSKVGALGPAAGGLSYSKAGALGPAAGGLSYSKAGALGPAAGGLSYSQVGALGPAAGGLSYSKAGALGPAAGGLSYSQAGALGPAAGGPSYSKVGALGPAAGGGPSYSQAGAWGPAAGGPSSRKADSSGPRGSPLRPSRPTGPSEFIDANSHTRGFPVPSSPILGVSRPPINFTLMPPAKTRALAANSAFGGRLGVAGSNWESSAHQKTRTDSTASPLPVHPPNAASNVNIKELIGNIIGSVDMTSNLALPSKRALNQTLSSMQLGGMQSFATDSRSSADGEGSRLKPTQQELKNIIAAHFQD